MVSRVFVAKVRNSPVGIAELARLAGTSRFWLSRLLSYADAVTAHDEKIVKLGQLVGLSAKDVFTS